MAVNNNIASGGSRQNNIGFRIGFFIKRPVYYFIHRLANRLRASTVAILAGFSIRDNTDLWAHAYGLHIHALYMRNSTAHNRDISDSHYVRQIISTLLRIRENKEIHFSISRTNNEIRNQIENLSRFHIWSLSIVKDAANTNPHLALAWSGVSIFLTILSEHSINDEAMLKGLNTVSQIQIFWKNYLENFVEVSDSRLSRTLRGALAKLYSSIIEYEVHCICHISTPRLFQTTQSINWDEMINSIQDFEESCLSLIDEVHKAEVRQNVKLQLEEIRKSRVIQQRLLDTITDDLQDTKERQLLSDLANVSKDYTRYKNINPDRVTKTCEWFLKDDRFCKWRESQSGQLLWLSAGPGCGKSVLSKCLIDEGLLNPKTTITISSSTIIECETVVCYFFFKEAGDGNMDSAHALCALLHQLFKYKSTSNLIAHALPSHKSDGQTLTQKVNELWRILVECANNSPVPIICVLDALDECKEDGRKELIGMLQKLYSSTAGSSIPSKLKFLITSRQNERFESFLKRLSSSTAYTYFDADDKSREIGREINHVIDFRMSQIADGFLREDHAKISKRLKSMKNRTYLWLYLTLSIVEEGMGAYSRGSDIQVLLSGLPPKVADAYEKILSRSQDDKKVEALLQIVLAATRPLTLDEANYALTLALDGRFSSHEKLERKKWPQHTFKTTVQTLCGLFISIHDAKLSFIHQTAREFLIHRERGTWKGRLSMSKSHGILSGACIKYLQILGTSVTTDKGLKWPMLSYAANSWFLHFRSQDADSTEKLRKPARELCRLSAPQAQYWVGHSSRPFVKDNWTDLHVASYLGLAAVANDLIKNENADVNAIISGKSPLRIAIDEGQLNVMELLLDLSCGALINEWDMPAAAYHKSNAKAMMSLLLDKLDECGSEVRITEDVLIYAVQNRRCGAATMALILKRRGNEVKVTQKVAESAAQWGSIETMTLLLNQRGHEFSITEDIIMEAIKKRKDLLAMLLKQDKVKITR
ncbi:hypothetical protein V8C42DRAFT_359993 [Trichoderma barbatum]